MRLKVDTLSAKYAASWYGKLERLGRKHLGDELFDEVIDSCMEGVRKPNPDIHCLTHACMHLENSPS